MRQREGFANPALTDISSVDKLMVREHRLNNRKRSSCQMLTVSHESAQDEQTLPEQG